MNNVQMSVAALSGYLLDLINDHNLGCLSPEQHSLLVNQRARPTESFSLPMVFGQGNDAVGIYIDLKLDRIERAKDVETLFYKYSFLVSWQRTIDPLETVAHRLLLLTTVAGLAKKIQTYVDNLGPVTMTRVNSREIILQ